MAPSGRPPRPTAPASCLTHARGNPFPGLAAPEFQPLCAGLRQAHMHAGQSPDRAHTLTQFRSAAAAMPSLPGSANTTPGESSSVICLSRWISCTERVTPGVLPT